MSFKIANEHMRLQMVLHRIDKIEWSERQYDHDYWCDVYAHNMTLADGTIVPTEDVEQIEILFPEWCVVKYIDWLH